jgi:hypothetical protein
MAAKFKRSGLHRLECESCDGYGYFTVAQLEAKGMPACWCGERLVPQRVELALMLGVEDAPIMAAYRAKVSSVAHGQASHYAKGRELESPEFRAVESISRDQRRAARARRIAAILPTPEPMPF